jgi:hypothetical protein
MFPHFIASKFVECQKQAVLWQLDHYHYEIEFTGNQPPARQLMDTPFEDAMVEFDKIEEMQND